MRAANLTGIDAVPYAYVCAEVGKRCSAGDQPYCDFLTIVETAKMRGIEPYRAVHATFAGEGGLFA